MGKRFRRLEPYGYAEQPVFEGMVNSVRQNINGIIEVNNHQEKEIDSKTVKIITSGDGKTYIITQGSEKIGVIEVNNLIDHARMIEVGGKQVLRLYFDEAETNYVDIDLSILKEDYNFNDSYTISFDKTIDGTTVNVTAKVQRLAYTNVDGNVPFAENGKIYDSNGNEAISVEASGGENVVNLSADKVTVGEIDDLEDTVNSLKENDVWKKSDEAGVRAEMTNTSGDAVIAKIMDDGTLYLMVEGEMMSVNDLLGQLAHETYDGGNNTYAP